MLNADVGIKGAGRGPDVRDHVVRSRIESAQILEQELTEILDDDGLRAKDITLLSPFRFEESSAALLPWGKTSVLPYPFPNVGTGSNMKKRLNSSPPSDLQILCQQTGKTDNGVFVQAKCSTD